MDNLFVIREKMRELYAAHSRVFDKGIQFVLALVTFYLINGNVGFMKAAASPVATLALAVICTFFPMIITVLLAPALILVHMFAASGSALAVTALIFLVLYIFSGNKPPLTKIFLGTNPPVYQVFSQSFLLFWRRGGNNPLPPPKNPPICAKLSTPSCKKPNPIAVAARRSMVE